MSVVFASFTPRNFTWVIQAYPDVKSALHSPLAVAAYDFEQAQGVESVQSVVIAGSRGSTVIHKSGVLSVQKDPP